MLLITEREIIKEELLFLLENGEILLSSQRYDEFLEKLIDIITRIKDENLPIYRFLEYFQRIILILKEVDEKSLEILDLLIMVLDLLKDYEEEIEDMRFEEIDIETYLLQSSRQVLNLNGVIIKNLSILNLLDKNKLKYFLKNDELNLKIFDELKDVNQIDLVLSPLNEFIVQKVRTKTDKPIVIVSEKTDENVDKFENIFYTSNKLDEDEFYESLVQIINTYKCKYIQEKINSIKDLKPLSDTIIKLQNLDENASLREISNIISKDIALSTKLVSIVNKPFFGVVKEISSVKQAITFLGKEKTLAYAFSLGISENLGADLNYYKINEDKFHKINFLRLKLASWWVRKVNFSDFVVISAVAMLGGIGKIFLNSIIDNLDTIQKEKFSILVDFDRLFAENEVLNTSTEVISAYLLTKWNFSSELVNSILYANNIEDSSNEMKRLAIMNYVIFNTFDLNDEIDDKIVQNMVDFLNEMNFDSSLYLEAIKKIKEIQ